MNKFRQWLRKHNLTPQSPKPYALLVYKNGRQLTGMFDLEMARIISRSKYKPRDPQLHIAYIVVVKPKEEAKTHV